MISPAILVAVYNQILAFVEAALMHVSNDEHAISRLLEITSSALLKNKRAAEEELGKICDDEKRQPQTFV
jgi:hypothetical protein